MAGGWWSSPIGQGGVELVREISRSIAGVKGWPYLLPDAVTPVDPGDEVRAELAGRYRVGADGEVVLELRGDELWLESPSLGEVRFHFADSSTMVCRERGGEITVVRTADGDVERLDAGLADELARPAAATTPWTRMAEGERTPSASCSRAPPRRPRGAIARSWRPIRRRRWSPRTGSTRLDTS